MWSKTISIEHLLWRILATKSMLYVTNMLNRFTVKDGTMNSYELLNIQSCSFLMPWCRGCTHSLAVSSHCWVVPLVSSRVSGYNQVVLLVLGEWHRQNSIDNKLTLATSHYLSQYWPRSMSPFDLTRPRWVIAAPNCIWFNVPSNIDSFFLKFAMDCASLKLKGLGKIAPSHTSE